MAQKMRDAWNQAQLGEILVESNVAVVVRTVTGVLEIPKAPPTELRASGRWLLGQTNELKSALAPRKKDS